MIAAKYEILKFSISGILITLFGDNYKLTIFLITTMIIDTLFGHLRAIKNKDWQSYNARWGLIGKIIELILVALVRLCEWTFAVEWLTNVVIIYFIICETASIAENIVKGHLNDNVPVETLEFLERMKTNFLTRFKEWIKDFFGGGGKSA